MENCYVKSNEWKFLPEESDGFEAWHWPLHPCVKESDDDDDDDDASFATKLPENMMNMMYNYIYWLVVSNSSYFP